MSTPMDSERGATPQTFVFADLAGYTALTEAHGDETAADTAAAFRAAAADLLVETGGEEVKALGDGLMLRIPDAASAIRLGSRLVRDTVGHRSLGVRVGMHTGSAVRPGDDWVGAAGNGTPRRAEAAPAGEGPSSRPTRRRPQAHHGRARRAARGP